MRRAFNILRRSGRVLASALPGRGAVFAPRALAGCLAACALLAPSATQNAVANGDTRTLRFVHAHNGEEVTVTFRVNGSYDSAGLQKLNWFLRDWRRDEPTRMDPRLFDTVWEVYRLSGSRAPIRLQSGYRSPATNSMLRSRSRGVAKQSQHMQGKAMDVHFMDVSVARIREIGMRLQRGGVGYYPGANSAFVHLDVGSVRHWPRMSYDQLARIFPDGKTVHIPSNGQPLPGYDQALAEIESTGGTAYASAYVQSQKSKGLFAFLFGGGEDEEEEVAPARSRGRGRAAPAPEMKVASAAPANSDDAGSQTFFSGYAPRQEPVAPPAIQMAMRPARQGATMPSGTTAPDVAAPDRRAGIRALADARAAEAKARLEARAAATIEARAAAEASAARAQALADARAAELRARGELQIASVPLPPRRPDLPLLAESAFADIPTPPVRPVEFASLRGDMARPASRKVSSLDDGALPSLVTEGAGQSGLSRGGALAYAAEPVAPAPRALPDSAFPRAATPDFVAARIDRATFRALTAQIPAARAVTQAALSPALAPLRAGRASTQERRPLSENVDVPSTFERPGAARADSRHFSDAAPLPPARPAAFGGLRALGED